MVLINILTPPPLPLNDIKERQLQSRIQLQLCVIIMTIYRSLMTQYQCRSFKLSLGGWGVKILWYNTLTPLPSKNIQEQYFVNGIQWQLSFKTQNIYLSQTILFGGWHFFNWMYVCVCVCVWGGGGSIHYGIIYWPSPPPPSKKYSRTVFVRGIQWQLSFKTQNIYISQTILLGGWHFSLMGCGGGGGQYIMV